MLLSGAKIIMECLKEQGVDTVFGFPGGAALFIYDALYDCGEINHILTCHEQHAAHAADGYARATGKTGVVFSTSGPGATNLVTGIANAYMDSTAMVIITSNVARDLLGKDSFQEIDITGVTSPITKHNVIVNDIAQLAEAVRDAFYIANSGRKGPVLVDVPKDIGAKEYEYTPARPKPPAHGNHFSANDITVAAKAIRESKQPFVYAGGGIVAAEAEQELFDFARKIGAPVTTSLMGTGAYPQDDAMYTGMIGMHGTKASALCASHCDLLIAIGARFSDRVTSDRNKFARQAKILHIDVDPAEINKNINAHYEITGNAKDILRQLNSKITEQKNKKWMLQAMEWKEKYPLSNGSQNAKYPKEILNTVQKYAPGDSIYATEVGQHQMWAAQFLRISRSRRFISSGGLGTMGFGLGAAIGAAIGTGSRVVNIAGDGSFNMNFQEIITAVKYNVPVTIVIMNNHVLGMVRQWQKMFYAERYCHTTLGAPIDYERLAKSLGAPGYLVKSAGELDAVMQKAFTHDGPVLVACDIHEDEIVLPMIPGGKGFEDIILEIEE